MTALARWQNFYVIVGSSAGALIGLQFVVLRRPVFRKSRVKGASAHRFRHTLATEVLIQGGSIEDAANLLGDSPEVIRRYYAKWSPAYQQRTVDLLNRVHGTPMARGENDEIGSFFSKDTVVLEVGVEPTCPVKGAGF